MKSIKIKFWGVRGSIPTPGSSTLRYGGNTACVELNFTGGPQFIMDAGSGIRELGKELISRKKPVNAYIFISHFHWDHIQGLPFFRPAYNPENQFTILGSDDTAQNLDQIISFQMNPTYFPIAIEDMKASIRFRSIKEETFELDGVHVETIYLNHPGYALGFKMSYANKTIIYISDNEPFHNNFAENTSHSGNGNEKKLEDLFDNFVENKDQKLINFCKNADILIHDSQFLTDEYQDKVSWGHSPFDYTVELAVNSRVKGIILFHHDPNHDDQTIDGIQKLSRDILQAKGADINCHAAQEGMVLEI